MRNPRPGSQWTPARQRCRIDYLAYIESAAWRTRRFRWLREHRERTGKAATCQVCGGPDDLELHHHEYTRLGDEHYQDLAALCHTCHQLLHDIYNTPGPGGA